MIKFVIPKLEQLSFRQELLGDKETMAYNDKWGGTIDFPKEQWEGWLVNWILNDSNERFIGIYLKRCSSVLLARRRIILVKVITPIL